MRKGIPGIQALLIIGAFATSATAQTRLRLDIPKLAEAAVRQSPVLRPSPIDQQWDAVRALASQSKMEVQLHDGSRFIARMVVADADGIMVTQNGKDTARVERATISRIRVSNTRRRVVVGAVTLAAGSIGGFLVCPYCANEGSGGGMAVLIGIGAGLGAIGFLIPHDRTVYSGPQR